MPAKDFLDAFEYDPEHFDYEKFKARLASEIDGDTDLANTRISAFETTAATDAATIRQLKLDKYDLLFKTGEAVEPPPGTRSTAQGGDTGDEMPSIDSLFKREGAQ